MKTYEKIYQYLLKKHDYISGEEIATHLGISRASVWKAVNTLKRKGISIISLKNKGYKIDQGDLILPEYLQEHCQFPIYFNFVSESTQSDAKNGITQQHNAPALYLANQQFSAKGRFNRDFFTQENKGIYMSLRLCPNTHLQDLKPYTIMVAACLVKAIFNLTGIKVSIKWVNDIYLDNKKIAGILTEAISSIESGLITDVIIGIGINFNITDFPDDLSESATSLFIDQPSITRNQLITEVWKLFFTTSEQDLFKIYRDASFVLGKHITFSEGNIKYSGKAIDLTSEGHLLVQLENKQRKLLKSGEISLSSWH